LAVLRERPEERNAQALHPAAGRLTTDAEARYHAMEGHCVAVLIPDADGSMWVGKPMVDGRLSSPERRLSSSGA
jgi:hypothetical protein